MNSSLFKATQHARLTTGVWRRFFSAGKIYELRTYDIQPSCIGPFMRLGEKKFHLRTKHSVLNGYWFAELGGINQAVHIWEYDSLEQRAQVRRNLVADKEWMEEYIAPAMKMVASQTNCVVQYTSQSMFLSKTAGSDANEKAASPGIYALITYRGNDFEQRILNMRDRFSVFGFFKTEIGKHDQNYCLIRSRNFDEGLIDLRAIGFDVMVSSKLMAPAAWSPLK